MKQIQLKDAPVGSAVFFANKRCNVIKQYTGFSREKNLEGERTGKKIPVTRTKLRYISTYQNEYGEHGMYESSTPITVERVVNNDGVYAITQDI